jgi:hypothetical protein
VDTSNVAVINVEDTCIETVYNTLLTKVTDTLFINLLSLPNIAIPNHNTLKIYPNPASYILTIDYGNYDLIKGYSTIHYH